MGKTRNFKSEDIPDLTGQVIIVTGGNTGLGYETIRQLAEHNPSRIYLAARSQEKSEAAIKSLTESNPSARISYLPLDLSSFASIKAAAEKFKQLETRLDILLNNAGIMMTPEGLSKEGYEIQFGTNAVGPTLLTLLLLPLIQSTAKINPQARVVNLSSASEGVAPKDIYPIKELKTTMSDRHTSQRYTISKIASIHISSTLAEKYKDVKIICVHPGMVATSLHHDSTGFFLRPFLYVAIALFATPVEKGALSQIWAAVSPDAKSGEYYSPVGIPGKGSKQSKDRKLQDQLWNYIEQELEGHY
ncbi:hypothetical protein D0Z00_002699 [Geotrichum galactomycetum]|uniref:Uncharacterized protein n=1 Tax=Geotrichum galactomycetum TaxID=27317 RepID=A0ACB6V3L9_9ASCO|nr:hypothetical protein D0Z00_002699 [Geotrichum candidum]